VQADAGAGPEEQEQHPIGPSSSRRLHRGGF